MASFRSGVVAIAAAVVLAPAVVIAAPAVREGSLVAAAAQPEAVASAEQAVSEARAALRHAMATGKCLKEARAVLTAALKSLDLVKARAPAVDGTDQGAVKPALDVPGGAAATAALATCQSQTPAGGSLGRSAAGGRTGGASGPAVAAGVGGAEAAGGARPPVVSPPPDVGALPRSADDGPASG